LRTTLLALGAAVLLAASGCSSVQYMETNELWAEGDARFDSGDYDGAIPYYDELLRRDEDNANARIMRGVAYERTGETSSALSDYGTAGRQQDVRGYLYSANLHIRRGELGQAEEDLRRLRDLRPQGADRVAHLTLLGTLRLKQGDHRMAAQNLERAITEGEGRGGPTIRGRVRDAHYNASKAYYNLGDFGRAYDHFVAYAVDGRGAERDITGGSVQLGPSDSYQLGLLAWLAGDFETADFHLAHADPDAVARGAEVLGDPTFGAGARRSYPE